MKDSFHSFEDCGLRLGCSGRTVRRLVDDGELPAFKIRGGLRIREADLNAYIESQRVQPRVEPTDLKSMVARVVERARERRRVSA